jgi:hypothetical protein
VSVPRVNLGASAIQSLLNNKQAVREFPFLKEAPLIKSYGGCGGCGGAKVRTNPDVNWIKRRIAKLDKTQKDRVRQLLNAKQVIGNYRENGTLKVFSF